MDIKQEIINELTLQLIKLETEYINLNLELEKEELMYRLAIYLIDTYNIDSSLL